MTAPPGDDRAADLAPRPLPAAGGLPLQTSEAEAVTCWWSQRFIALLESFGLGSRLERGHAYGLAGQVLELEVEPGIALAKVQGTRFTPYRVRIRPPVYSERQWRRAERAIAARASTLALLLAGEMPPEVEEVLAEAKLALLPGSYDELRASCTCPDDANPCKHTAAAFYVLAERFAADPFALFTLRGRTREELLDALRARRSRAVGTRLRTAPSPAALEREEAAAEAPRGFWRAGAELETLQVCPLASEAPDVLLRRPGPGGLGPGGAAAVELLAGAYARLAAAAEQRALTA